MEKQSILVVLLGGHIAQIFNPATAKMEFPSPESTTPTVLSEMIQSLTEDRDMAADIRTICFVSGSQVTDEHRQQVADILNSSATPYDGVLIVQGKSNISDTAKYVLSNLREEIRKTTTIGLVSSTHPASTVQSYNQQSKAEENLEAILDRVSEAIDEVSEKGVGGIFSCTENAEVTELELSTADVTA